MKIIHYLLISFQPQQKRFSSTNYLLNIHKFIMHICLIYWIIFSQINFQPNVLYF